MRWWRQLRSLLLRTVVVLLLAPTAIVALYRVLDPPLTPLMVIRLFEGEGLARSWRSLDEISPHLARAVIAAEDNLFCRHHGFDTAALQRALQDYIDGERAPGASTITMQTAKNILLWPGRDPVRKLIEAWLTPQIELFWPKRRILEVYLNVVEMGPGIYGAEAAARAYFGKAAVALGPQESALIAAVLPNPRIWSPKHPTRYVAGRARTIAGRVGQLGPLLDCA
jgi:monofunctional biosynthetic peptidoglycan transglycosylase